MLYLTYGSCREVNDGLDHWVWGHGVRDVIAGGFGLSQLCGYKNKIL